MFFQNISILCYFYQSMNFYASFFSTIRKCDHQKSIYDQT